MKIDLRGAEDLLGISAVTIQRWVRQGRIPVCEEGGTLLFRRKELERWARDRQLPLRQDPVQKECITSPDDRSLSGAMRRGGVFFDAGGQTVDDVLRELVSLAPLPSEVDAALLLERLRERESMASTGIGHGIAIPHPRYPLQGMGDRPIITTAFLRQPVDFCSVDGDAVGCVFLMLSPSTQIHLHLLSRLSFCLRDTALLALLPSCREENAFLETVERIEKAL